ncbi:fimbrial protein [Chromobacterium haemolyticum]|nr:fimbrial protein [Chromobacterium haemolyticum]
MESLFGKLTAGNRFFFSEFSYIPMKMTIKTILASTLATSWLALSGITHAGVCTNASFSIPAFHFSKTYHNAAENPAAGTLLPNVHSWQLDKYSATCFCSTSKTPRRTYFFTRIWLESAGGETINGKDIQFFRINPYVEVGVELFLGGAVQRYMPLPWWNPLTNDEAQGEDSCTYNTAVSSYMVDRHNLDTGTRGRVHLRISKPFSGTVNVPAFVVFQLLGATDSSAEYNAFPLENLVMSLNVSVPQSCTLAAGQVASIDFGALPPEALATPGGADKNAVKRTFQIQCNNIASGAAVQLSLEGQPQGQDPRYLATSHSAVGIAMESSGKLVPPTPPGATPAGSQHIPIALDYQSQQAQFQLLAWPVKMTTRPSPAPFQGSATLRFDFE